MKNLLSQKKLCLVLDLDHTLLNSTKITDLKPEEVYLLGQANSLRGDVSKRSLAKVHSLNRMIKLRPFVHTFLKEANQLFELCIFTLASEDYAKEMVKLLDPKREYFNGRVISREDYTQKDKKDLNFLQGKENAVVILDDTEDVWMKNRDNLILMKRYHYYASSWRMYGYDCKSFSMLRKDEPEPDGPLASVLRVLKEIHHNFFNELDSDFASQDVREILKAVRNEVLKGCIIVFDTCLKEKADTHPLWKMAEQFGATCLTEIDPSVTHVVSIDAGTETSCWAVKEKKFLVSPRWITASIFLWQNGVEKKFPVSQNKTKEK